MKNKKVVVGIIGILFVAACVIVFAYFRGNSFNKRISEDYEHRL